MANNNKYHVEFFAKHENGLEVVNTLSEDEQSNFLHQIVSLAKHAKLNSQYNMEIDLIHEYNKRFFSIKGEMTRPSKKHYIVSVDHFKELSVDEFLDATNELKKPETRKGWIKIEDSIKK